MGEIPDLRPTRFLDHLIDVAATAYGLTAQDILGSGRRRTVLRARMVTYFLGSTVYEISHSDLARWYATDHSTVMSGIRQVRSSPKLLDEADQLRLYLESE